MGRPSAYVRKALLVMLAVSLSGVMGLGPGVAVAVPDEGSVTARPVTEITPEDLLAATLRPADVQQLFSRPERWWPEFPEFIVGIGAAADGPMPGERFFVGQNYQQVDDPDETMVRSTLILFEDEATAAAGFAMLRTTEDADGSTVPGPAVGDQFRYFTRSTEEFPAETTLRFRTGPVVGRVTQYSQADFAAPDAVARYAGAVIARIGPLLDGALMATPLPAAMAGWLPPSGASTVGPEIGSAVAPAESWALIDSADDPMSVRERLHRYGATELGYRRYRLSADPNQVVDLTLFPFRNSQSAAAWVREFVDTDDGSVRLDPGRTGELSVYAVYEDSYEIQFAKGRLAADVSCSAPFGEVSAACEPAVRQMAEMWFEVLPTS